MDHLFFNYNGALIDAARHVFSSLDLPGAGEGDSANVAGGCYYTKSLLGIVMRLEENTYDYEDEYGYMLAIRQDPCRDMQVADQTVNQFAHVVVAVLAANSGLQIAIETDGALKVFASE